MLVSRKSWTALKVKRSIADTDSVDNQGIHNFRVQIPAKVMESIGFSFSSFCNGGLVLDGWCWVWNGFWVYKTSNVIVYVPLSTVLVFIDGSFDRGQVGA